GKDVVDLPDGAGVDPHAFQPGAVIAEIPANRAHQARAHAKQSHRVGDVGCNAAPVLGHVFDKKTQADLMQLIAQQMLAESAGETHQIVVGDGARQYNVHHDFLIFGGVPAL